MRGHGANGTTWEALAPDGSRVAIKELPLTSHVAAKSRELWMREARVLKELTHPQIPALVEVFLTGTGRSRTLCIVQEFVEGCTLAEELLEHRYTEAEVLEIARDLAGVLAYLHGLSPPVVHRDLKPANVMRSIDGRLVLVDFGSVRDVVKDPKLGGSTTAGTFGYMAPEQFRGDAEPATDFYGLGCLMVALLTRKDLGQLHRRDGVVDWRSHCAPGPDTARLLEGLLAPDPEARPAGLVAMERLLEPGFVDVDGFAGAQELFDPSPEPELPARPASNPLVAPAVGLSVGMITLFVVLVSIGIYLGGSAVLTRFAVSVPADLVDPIVQPVPIAPTEKPAGVVQPLMPSFYRMDRPVFLLNQTEHRMVVQYVEGAPVRTRELLPSFLGKIEVDAFPAVLRVESDGEQAVFEFAETPKGYFACTVGACVEKPFANTAPGGWTKKAIPSWPTNEPTGLGPQTCMVDTSIDPSGVVVHAHGSGCGLSFARAAEAALRSWSHQPGPEPMRTQVRVIFKDTPPPKMRPPVDVGAARPLRR